MKRRLIPLALLLLLAFSLPLASASPNENARQSVYTPSGRLKMATPTDWVYRIYPQEEEIRGLDSETFIVGTSFDVIDAYLSRQRFDGTLMFISAYPYHVFEPHVLGDPVAMLADVTVLSANRINPKGYGSFKGAEFYYEEAGSFFALEILMDTGEMAYRSSIYSTRSDDYDDIQAVLSSAEIIPISFEETFALDSPTRDVRTEDNRLTIEIPRNWLYWNEGDTSVGFASSPAAYADVSYAYRPQSNSEVVFIVQRLVTSALRADEIIAERADLPAVMERLRAENDGLRKQTPLIPFTLDGAPTLDAEWAIAGAAGSVLTRTRLIDGHDTIYLIQAQYSAQASAPMLPMIDKIFNGMRYTAPANPSTAREIGLEIGQIAPDFNLPLLGGHSSNLSDFRGKVVLMNLWATWCGPCHREAPAMQDYYERYGGRFEILAVNVAESASLAQGFVNDYALTFPVLLDNDARIASLYELTAYPTTYIIGRDGVILEKVRGAFRDQSMRDILAIYVGAE